jgi:hypothetical protein
LISDGESMVNKRGILKIIEASIAIMIIFSAILTFSLVRNAQTERDLSGTISPLLEEIAKNNSLRDGIIGSSEGINETISNFVASRLGEIEPNVNSTVKICNIYDVCGLDSYPTGISGGVYAGSRIISSSLGSGATPKRVSIFLWMKG